MTRDQKLISVLVSIAVLAAGAVTARIVFSDPPPLPMIERTVDVGADGRLSLQFVGDTFIGDRAVPYIAKYGYDWPFQRIKPMLDADFTIATAEAAITSTKYLWNPGKKYSYKTPPETAPAMARAGIDAVTLANNHVFDAGEVGLKDTARHARAAGMAAFGAGPDLATAQRPLLLKTKLGTIGIVGFGESFGFRADEAAPGIPVLHEDTIGYGVAAARQAGADWVVAYVHWGDNYAPINQQQRYWARQLAKEGYDLVIGSGPHAAQPVDVIGSVPIFYSLGNFVFSTRGQWEGVEVPGVGLSAELILAPNRKPEVSVRCLLTDNAIVKYQPRACTAAEAREYLPRLHAGTMGNQERSTVVCDCFIRGYE